jgi:MFS family permease
MNLLNVEKKGWAITLTGALFFFYAFIQANVITSLSSDLAKAFNTSASSLSLLSAFYFYANIIFIIPAGLLLDRYSVKLLMGYGLIFAIIGTFLLAFAPDIKVAYLGRFLCGIMMAFGLVSCLKLASLLLPPNKMALASSLIITIGMIGGIVSQAPIAYLTQHLGWRGALISLAFLGFLIALVLMLVIKVPKMEKLNKEAKKEGIFQSLKEVFQNGQNWYAGLFTSIFNFPVAILGALFGVPCLTQVHGFSHMEACSVTAMLFFGMLFGSPFFGWLSDHIGRRKPPMYIGAFSLLILMFILVFASKLSVFTGYLLFFLMGFFSASQVLGYPVIAESNPPRLSGTALSLAGLLIMGLGYGIALPFVGWMLDLTWDGQVVNGVNLYSIASYRKALMALPIAGIVGLLMIFLIKETKCQPIYKK